MTKLSNLGLGISCPISEWDNMLNVPFQDGTADNMNDLDRMTNPVRLGISCPISEWGNMLNVPFQDGTAVLKAGCCEAMGMEGCGCRLPKSAD